VPNDIKRIPEENIYHNPLIKDEHENTIQPLAVLTRYNIYKIKDLETKNMTTPIRKRLMEIKKLLPEWTKIQTS
jgi:hypothetical protein